MVEPNSQFGSRFGKNASRTELNRTFPSLVPAVAIPWVHGLLDCLERDNSIMVEQEFWSIFPWVPFLRTVFVFGFFPFPFPLSDCYLHSPPQSAQCEKLPPHPFFRA